jgi:hypothetical protein
MINGNFVTPGRVIRCAADGQCRSANAGSVTGRPDFADL